MKPRVKVGPRLIWKEKAMITCGSTNTSTTKTSKEKIMKKFLVAIALAFAVMFASLAHAQFNWVTANQGTFTWDAVVADGGNPTGTHVEYRVSRIDSITDVATVTETTTAIQSTVTLPEPGRYWVGVNALLMDDGSGEVLQTSEFARSNLPEYCLDGATFGFQMWPTILAPTGMREGGG
jgi:hypothetical protein